MISIDSGSPDFSQKAGCGALRGVVKSAGGLRRGTNGVCYVTL